MLPYGHVQAEVEIVRGEAHQLELHGDAAQVAPEDHPEAQLLEEAGEAGRVHVGAATRRQRLEVLVVDEEREAAGRGRARRRLTSPRRCAKYAARARLPTCMGVWSRARDAV